MPIANGLAQLTDETQIRDELALSIVNYIGENLNWILEPISKIAVKTAKTYDAIGLPSNSYPLLKCYRVQENYYVNTSLSITNFNLQYVLALPDQDFLVSLSTFMAKSINTILIGMYDAIGIKTYEETAIQVIYNTATDQQSDTFLSLLTFNFSVYGT